MLGVVRARVDSLIEDVRQAAAGSAASLPWKRRLGAWKATHGRAGKRKSLVVLPIMKLVMLWLLLMVQPLLIMVLLLLLLL